MKTTAFELFYSTRLKYIGIFFIVLGVISLFCNGSHHYPLYHLNMLCKELSWGFCFIFFSKEKVDDERIHMLKFRSLAFGVPIGLAITHLLNYYFIINWEHNGGAPESISGSQSLVIILGLSLAAFYFQKFQGGRE